MVARIAAPEPPPESPSLDPMGAVRPRVGGARDQEKLLWILLGDASVAAAKRGEVTDGVTDEMAASSPRSLPIAAEDASETVEWHEKLRRICRDVAGPGRGPGGGTGGPALRRRGGVESVP